MNNILRKIIFCQKQIRLLLMLLSFLITLPVAAQDAVVISGAIVSETGEGFPGVTILEMGTSNGTVTDIDGNFTLTVTDGNATLKVSFVGYETQEVKVGGRSTLEISLAPDVKQLEEIVVIGYGTQKKSHLTGAISKVKNEKLDQIAVSRADEALLGQVSGVLIQNTGGSSNDNTPDQGVGSAPTIRIRGTGSVSGGANPLLVIDGVMVDYSFWSSIDMNDVESIEVLKDAASASIFGSRGANGVIMITTKAGKEGNTQFSYNMFFGVQDALRNPNYNRSVAEGSALELEETGELSLRQQYKESIGVDHNWQDDFFNGGIIQSHSLSARGGNKKTTFSTNITYLHDEGVLVTDDFKKYNLKAQIKHKFNKKFQMSLSVNPSFTQRRRFDGSTHDVLRQAPWLPIYHDDSTIQFVDRENFPDVQVGDYARQDHFDNYPFLIVDGDTTEVDIGSTGNTNPMAKILEKDRRDEKFKIFGKLGARYKISNDFSVNAAFSAAFQSTEYTRWQGVLSRHNGAEAASSNYQEQTASTMTGQTFLDYKKTLGDHQIDATVGALIETNQNDFYSITGTGYTSDEFRGVRDGTTIADSAEYSRESRLLSFISRVNYSYKDKYLFSASFRRDGSSVFGSDSKFGNFPALSFGWRVSEENFLKNSKVLNNLKFRFSYGVTGNDNINVGSSEEERIRAYYSPQALLNLSSAVVNNATMVAQNPINIANNSLQWERSIEYNPAVDFGLFGNIITGSFDYYQRISDALLLDNPVSSTTGFNTALVNIGEVKNEGFEFELRANIIRGDKFTWSVTGLGSKNKNTLTDFADSDGQIQSVDEKRAAEWINLVGHPISSFYGWVVKEELPKEHIENAYHPIGGEARDVYVRDINGDGVIDDDDKTVLGSPYPDFNWSITNEFKIGPVDVSFMFQGSHGAEVRNMADQYLYNHFNSQQDQNELALNPENLREKIFTSSIVQDASYISLRTINIGYTFSKSLINKARIDNARIYFTAQNVWYAMADGYTGFNPESIRRTSPTTYGYQVGGGPVAQKFTVGVNLDF
ncbi:MAG: TonB-dependent receptor [Reichenbachiella sp.]